MPDNIVMQIKETMMDEININHSVYKTRLSDKFINRKRYAPEDKSKVYSFIPGTIVEIIAGAGDSVEPGSELLVLEAMKMKNRILSSVKGVVKSVNVETGQVIPKGYLIVEIDLED
jgi:biotin carboxyl carrier protein